MKRFKAMAGQISNMKKEVKYNDRDISRNSRYHKNNAKSVDSLHK